MPDASNFRGLRKKIESSSGTIAIRPPTRADSNAGQGSSAV